MSEAVSTAGSRTTRGAGRAYRPGTAMKGMGRWLAVLMVSAGALLGMGCDAESQTRTRELEEARRYTPRDLTALQRYGGQHVGGTATGDTRDGAAFARWVLEQDPQRRYITDAVVRNDQVLGVKVQPTITKGELRDLLTALAEGMARTFPGKPLVVNAFYQSGDQLAEAVYNPRTGLVDVRFA